MGAGSQGFESAAAFPDLEQGAGWEAEQLGHEPAAPCGVPALARKN